MSNNIDIKTLEAFQDGNHKAFETVFIAYYNKTKAFIDGYIKSESDAEELTEDLFVNLWINHDSIDASKSFSSYLHTIARNSAINFLKHKYVHDTYLNSSQEIEYSSTSEEDLIAKELGLLIDDIVGKMSEQRKMIYTLSRQEGLSNAEIAIQLNTTKRNVESQLSLALKETVYIVNTAKMEKSNIITRIIKKFLSGRFSVETEEKVQRWIMKEENAEEKEKASLEYWNELDTEADSKTYSALERVNLRTGYNKEHLENIVLYHKFVRIVAVVIPICLLAGGLLYYIPSENEQIEISTAYGEQKRLVLPDSSEVWLNAGSTITYPKTFTKENRVVTLDGEAYFSVRKDDAKPFIVETSQLSVKVLGTKFNVKAYANDANITTTLTSGKVEVSTQSRPPQTLKPNEQLTYDKSTSDIEISTVDTVDTNSWVKGKIIFTNATAEEIFRTLERRYDTVIDHSTDFSASRRYTVKFLKDENLDEMLNILGDIIGFSYRQSGNKIIITK